MTQKPEEDPIEEVDIEEELFDSRQRRLNSPSVIVRCRLGRETSAVDERITALHERLELRFVEVQVDLGRKLLDQFLERRSIEKQNLVSIREPADRGFWDLASLQHRLQCLT